MTTPLPENCVPLLCQAAELGLKLGVKDPNTLTVEPAKHCPPEFADTLRVHKSYLLILLRLPFVMVESQTLEETVFFCDDEQTKAALIEAGADEWSIHTRDELQTLCCANRVAPLSPDELRKVHEIKRTFSGRISS